MTRLSSALASFSLHGQLDAPDAKTIAGAQMRLPDTLAVHERAVRALQVHDFQPVVGRRQPAVYTRHQRGIDDEVGARCAADGFDGS